MLRSDKELRAEFEKRAEEAGLGDKTFTELLELVRSGTDEEARLVLNALSGAQSSGIANETVASQEIERDTIDEALKDAQYIGYGSTYYANYDEQLRKSAQETIDSYGGEEEFGMSADEYYEYLKNNQVNQPTEYSKAYADATKFLAELEGVEMDSYVDYNGNKIYSGALKIGGASAADQLSNLRNARAALEEEANKAAENNEEELQKSYESWIRAIDKQIDAVETQKNNLDSLNDTVNAEKMQEAFDNSLASWDTLQIKNATLDEAISVMAEKLTLSGERVYDMAGNLTEEARNRIVSYLREQDDFSSLFQEDERKLRDLLNDQGRREELISQASGAGIGSYEQLKNIFSSALTDENEKQRQEILNAINDVREVDLDMEGLRNLIFTLDPTRMENFASALGMTVEECKSLRNVLGDATLSDLLAPPEDTLDKIEQYTSIFTDILSDGQISANNLLEVLDKFPSLLNKYNKETGKLESVGTENIQSNLLSALYGGEGSLGTILGFNLYEDLKSNKEVFSSFKELLKTKPNFSDKDLEFLDNFTSFSDDALHAMIQNKEIWTEYENYMNQFQIDTEAFKETVDNLITYKSQELDTQISALEEQKNALSSINEERKKELDLIKAKDALENAKKEKKMVYRAGVGWTYESDQTAIQEAQQNLEDLETDKESENLQYQIDQLEKQKAFLEAIPNSAELEAQKETYEEWMNMIGANEETQKDILGELATLYTNIGIIGKQVGQWVERDETKLSTEEGKAYAALNDTNSKTSLSSVQQQLSTLQNSENKNTLAYNAEVDKARENFLAMRSTLEATGIGDYINTDYEDLEEDATIRNFIKDEAAFEQLKQAYRDYVTNGNNILDTTLKNTVVYMTKKGFKNPNGKEWSVTDTDKTYKVDLTTPVGDSATLMSSGNGPYNHNKKEDAAVFSLPGETGWSNEVTMEEAQREDKGKAYLEGLPEGAMVAFVTDNKTDPARIFYKDGTGNWYKAAKKGSLGLPGGYTLVNEEGTEGIITPQGTLTTLPSRTGVVPADITKNLWALGEVAPNLVKNLDSITSKFPEGSFGSSDDHSTNINNLYATFQTNENFDVDEFLVDVRGIIGTTRHSF